MRDAAEIVAQMVVNRTFEEFANTTQVFWTVVKMIEIIGEAASKIAPEAYAEIDLPWLEIIGMRNRLSHAYFDLNAVIVWKTATEDVPPLREKVAAFLEREGERR